MTDEPTASTDAVLRRGLAGHGGAFTLTLDPLFQGLPDTAHGGSILGVFDAVHARPGARLVSGVYHRRVPLATPLELRAHREAEVTRLQLSQGATLLVDGIVAPGDGAAPRTLVADTAGEARPLPVSRTCFACGVDNALGLHARLTIADTTVRTTWTPRERHRGHHGATAPVAIVTLLDEAAFWLGAAASGEAGMTTDLRVTLHAPPAPGAITVMGRRAAVRAQAGDPRYWDTEIGAWDSGGAAVATARITFVAVRGAARKLVAGLLSVNAPDVLHRVFPAYAP